MALLIDSTHEVFAFLSRSRVGVAQKTVKGEWGSPDEVRRCFSGLLWLSIHFDHYFTAYPYEKDGKLAPGSSPPTT